MNSKTERILSIFIGVVIISYGIISVNVVPVYQNLVEDLLGSELSLKLLDLFSGTLAHEKDVYNLGKYFVYYPSYILLHAALISLLFWKKPKSRNIGLLVLLLVLPILAGLTLLFYWLGWQSFYHAAHLTLANLIGYPIILFLVEGGRIIYADIDSLIK